DMAAKWLHHQVVPLADGIAITTQDVTAAKAAQEERARLASVLEATTDFVSVAAPDGRVLYYNAAARRTLGMPADLRPEFAHLRPRRPPDWAGRKVLEEAIPAAIRDGVWVGETALLDRDGREVPLSQVILAHRDARGEVAYLSTIARDITAQKR